VLASAAVMESLHLSTALGAFIAGVMLADSPYRHELEVDIEPFRSILLGLFFVAVGMLLDLSAIAERPLFVIGMAAALIAAKAIVLFGLAKAFGMETRRAFKLGLLLSQGGEFGFVLFAAAQDALLDRARGRQPVRGDRHRLDGDHAVPDDVQRLARSPGPTRQRRRHGRAGTVRRILRDRGRLRALRQTVAQMLMAKGIALTLIDSKSSQIELSGNFGAKVYYGDGTRLDLLRAAGAETAKQILFCIDGDDLSPRKLEPILEAFPHAQIFRPALRPAPHDPAERARPAIRDPRGVRILGADGPRSPARLQVRRR
jgi:hypothetical protein